MEYKHWTDRLKKLNACPEAVVWAKRYATFEDAWVECDRGDWMLWLAARVFYDRKASVLCACACARLALCYVPNGEERPRKAIEAAEAWVRGEVTLKDVHEAYADADAAAFAAHAAAIAAADARAKTLHLCADLARQHIDEKKIASALQTI